MPPVCTVSAEIQGFYANAQVFSQMRKSAGKLQEALTDIGKFGTIFALFLSERGYCYG